ncbi:MAG: phosphoribosylformylglycinamidine synthase subunit PurQ [Pirellulales bacterium]|nr:phosphoribosylformylglycinamidine synthase subunit PurQ [Pirellulales bacterium]
MQPRVLILRAPGANCDGETAHAFSLAGGKPDIVHVRRVVERPQLLAEFQILCIPGGFSYGDDIASGRILGIQLQQHLAGALQEFKLAGKLILGICNGFQVLFKCGLLRNDVATLAWNTSGRFEDRWVNLQVPAAESRSESSGFSVLNTGTGQKSAERSGSHENQRTVCAFLVGIQQMYLPVAHGEGRFVARDDATLNQLQAAGRLALRYAPLSAIDNPSCSISLDQSLPFPDNPNGSQLNVAGMCDETGRIFGLMPHPERHIDRTQHPRWTRGDAGEVGDGLRVFQNAVRFFQ